MAIRTLILSGGGGRGAFHAGVYKYLQEADKADIKASHAGPWTPEIVVGTSIGAVNGAAITQGISAADLEQFWLTLREKDVQALPPGMAAPTRWIANWVLRSAIGADLAQAAPGIANSPQAHEAWPPIPMLPAWIADRLIGRWSNLLDTSPLRHSLEQRLGLDEAKIAQSQTMLLINATNIRTGEGVIFSNRAIKDPLTGLRRGDCRPGITLKRIIASCSIPLVYPWTKDDDGEIYWDGALVANTPLGAAFDTLSDRPIDDPMEVIVVILSPWWDPRVSMYAPRYQKLPANFGEAAAWALDWTMLASFRVSLKMLYAFNGMAEANLAAGRPQQYRLVKVTMIAPDDFLPVERIIDYDTTASQALIERGYEAAKRAFQKTFGEH
jgi:NTE family protein